MTWVYAGTVSPERRYQLQNAEANQQIDETQWQGNRFGQGGFGSGGSSNS